MGDGTGVEKIYIFGAHSRAWTLKEYLTTVYPSVDIIAFLVNDEEENPSDIEGIPVIHLDEVTEGSRSTLDTEARVYLAIRGVGHSAATEYLQNLGFDDIVPVTVDLDMELRNAYLEKHFSGLGRRFEKIDTYPAGEHTDDSLSMFVVSSAFDSVLREHHEYTAYEKIIQVGCALTDRRIEGALYDDHGDNISDKNQQFCELTATYWVWKNSGADYVGIEHYRRFFLTGDDIADVMSSNSIDVIMPTPLCVMPSLKENYLFRHEKKPFRDMMSLIKKQYPKDYERAVSFFDQGLYSPCNMLIARKSVYDRLCGWMFPILFEVCNLNGTFDDRYQNRYPGFLSERLMSFFFDMHRDEYKVVYADKNFLS